MFTWICPRCGREVPPSYDECPDCAKGQQPAAASVEAAGASPVQPQPAPPAFAPAQPAPAPAPVYAAPPNLAPPSGAPAYAPAGYAAAYGAPAAPRAPLPTWLLTIVFALAFAGLVGGVYWVVGVTKRSNAGAAAKPRTAAEQFGVQPGATPSPYQKYIEISGIRFLENAKKKPEVHFVVTNHSGAAIDGLSGNVTIWARTQKSEEEAAGTFQFTTSIGGWESKDLSAPLTTKYEMIELPDWQNTTADVQITAPR